MNRMNLPPPFEELESEFPALKEVYNIEKYKDIFLKENIYDKENEGNNIYNFFSFLFLNFIYSIIITNNIFNRCL